MCLGYPAGSTGSNMQLGAACPEGLPVSVGRWTLEMWAPPDGEQDQGISARSTVTRVRPP